MSCAGPRVSGATGAEGKHVLDTAQNSATAYRSQPRNHQTSCRCGKGPRDQCAPLCLFRRDAYEGGARFALLELCDSFAAVPCRRTFDNLAQIARRYLAAYDHGPDA